ncbi:sensor histidine kinase [Paenibacillus piri]|uniref:Sensor histidine kinase n=1 Tax=Paenibacillus piri TaxID=2547395 RepID=A0A4R5KUW6_9BACL|nr:sensor histidine kinase [Paenibacillus piri]TDF98747.1 sensor histidine kinase [Paenibacillus piri]
MKRQWKLRPFLFSVMVMSNIFFLLLITIAIYVSVTYFFTKQISEARLQVLYSNQLQLIERVEDVEGMALTISTHPIIKDVLEHNDSIDLYDYILLQRKVSEWLNTFTFVKPYIDSIQIYTDQYAQYQQIGPVGKNMILPLTKMPWKEEMPQFSDMDAIWVPSHGETMWDPEKRVLTYVLKIYNRKGGTAGFVAINMNEDSWVRLFFKNNAESSPTNRSLLVLDSNNRIMSRMSADMNSRLMKTFESYLDTINQQAGYRQLDMNGNKYLMIYSMKNQEKWRIVEFLENDQLYRDVQIIRNIMLIIGVVILLFIFPVSSYLSSRIIRPVPDLLKGFQQIEKGNFDTSLKKHSIVEFNKLVHAFNLMAIRLQGTIEELDKKNRLKRDLELTVLQSQINPHFLYNTLDMINWAAAMKGNMEVSFMASKLAKLFRISLSGGSPFIVLQEELEHAGLYAQIQQLRLQDRFMYSEHVKPNFKQCYVPKIILQPFIENSIIHGFSVLHEEKAEVSVSAERIDEDTFKIIIVDNGTGLDRQQKDESEQRKKSSLYVSGSGGYGIKNVRERLELYLGSQYGVHIENRETRGVKVTITLPYLDSIHKVNCISNLK